MRFAAIADVHGNHLALEAVLADIRAQGVTDHRQSRRHAERPARCAADHRSILMTLDAVHVLGNHDPLSARPPAGKDGLRGTVPRSTRAQCRAISTGSVVQPMTRVFREHRSSSATRRPMTTKSIGSTPCIPTARSRCRRSTAIEHVRRRASSQSLILCAHTHLRPRGAASRRPADRQSRQRRHPRLSRRASIPACRRSRLRRTRATRSSSSSNCNWQVTFRHVPTIMRAMAALLRTPQWHPRRSLASTRLRRGWSRSASPAKRKTAG